jgi:hypothetical protein
MAVAGGHAAVPAIRQSLQPLPHGLAFRPRAVKNQRDFSRLWLFCHSAPYIVLPFRILRQGLAAILYRILMRIDAQRRGKQH